MNKDKAGLAALLAFLFFLGVALLSSGCGGVKKLAVKEEVVVLRPAETNMVELYTTNRVVETLTNAVGELLILQHTNVVTNLQAVILPEILFTNKVLSPTLEKGVEGAGRVASNLGIPFADAIAGGLTGLAGLLFGWFNRRKRREALAALDGERADKSGIEKARDLAEDAVAVLTQNIDSIRETARTVPGYSQHDDRVMQAIKAAQKLLGVHAHIDSVRKSDRVLNDKS